MPIQINDNNVIDDDRNFVGISSVNTGIAGTQSWSSGKSTFNIDGNTGNIVVDGPLKLSGRSKIIIPLA